MAEIRQDATQVLRSLPEEAQTALAEYIVMSSRAGGPNRFDEIAYLKAAALLNRQRRGEV